MGSNDSRDLVRYAFLAPQKIFRLGYKYQKCGVIVSGLVPENARQLSLFESTSIRQEDPAATVRMQDTRTMEVMDALNKRYGSGVVKLGATMSTTQTEGWKMQRSLLSPRYTTNFHEIQIARCR